MSSEIEPHITKKYEIKKRLGKGVRYRLLQCLVRSVRPGLITENSRDVSPLEVQVEPF